MSLSLVLASHRGLVRERNEDALGLEGWSLQGDAPPCLSVQRGVGVGVTTAVCDGMGGHGSGEVASRIAAEAVTGVAVTGEWAPDGVEAALRDVFQQTSDRIVVEARHSEASTAMGCTAVVAVVSPNHQDAVIAHVGDSRAYIMDQGVLTQLTADDRKDTNDPTLTQALGGGRLTLLDTHTTRVALRDGNTLLLCSDGLHDLAGSEELTALAREFIHDPEQLAAQLVTTALRAGGRDNVSVVVITVEGIRNSPEVLTINL